MGKTTIDRLIINSPYEDLQRHWRYDRETHPFKLIEDRRWAGYVVATPGSKSFDDPSIFMEIQLVNKIWPCVKLWRKAGYSGVASITKRLLEHRRDPEWEPRFFFSQGILLRYDFFATPFTPSGKQSSEEALFG